MDQVAADDAELDDWARTLRKSKRGGRGQAEGRCFYCSEAPPDFQRRLKSPSSLSMFLFFSLSYVSSQHPSLRPPLRPPLLG